MKRVKRRLLGANKAAPQSELLRLSYLIDIILHIKVYCDDFHCCTSKKIVSD